MDIYINPEPEVTLINYFQNPYDTVVAAARTCYSSKVIMPEDVSKTEKARSIRDKIFKSVYDAGHHTTMQHPTFQFIINKVSRHFLWSFLHSHPFYNSEQVSQRYVEVKPENFLVPKLDGKAYDLYTQTARAQTDAYFRLAQLTQDDIKREYFRIFPKRDEKEYENAVHKKVIEIARYALPIATHAHLYHTISGITLYRYFRLCNQFDTPHETRIVVNKMVEEVQKIDPDFFKFIKDPLALEQTPEYEIFKNFNGQLKPNNNPAFVKEFDTELGKYCSKLIDYHVNSESTMAKSIRTTFGMESSTISDEQVIDLVMNPTKNKLISSHINLMTLSKLCRSMFHPHFTFMKKLSHTADSQDQRHRMTPASRPILMGHFVADKPDYIAPFTVEKNPAAIEFFDNVMKQVWQAINRLLELGVSWEFAQYLLPNAFPIRFIESGDLLNLHHKWTSRLCYLAQKEIWRCSLEELMQVKSICPNIARYIHAPCRLRKLANINPYCPESDRFCGVAVWDLELSEFERLI